jgi:ABC-type branched-subunit amino acid transport system substrate-binding protein
MVFNTKVNSILGVIIALLLIAGIALVVQRAPDPQRGFMSSGMDESGITKDEILLGSSSALTGHAEFLGTQYTHGSMSWINEVNDAGGIHGRKIRLISYDDQYDPPRTVENTRKLIFDDKVFMLYGYVGTPTSVKIIDIVHEQQIPSFGFLTGAESLRIPFRPYMFHLRASYYEEAEGAVKYFVDTLGMRKIGVLYQDDAFGKAVLAGIQLAIWNRQQEWNRDLDLVAVETYVRGTMDVEYAVDSLKASGAEAVIIAGTYNPLAKFIKLSHDNGFTPFFHTVSFVGSAAFARAIKMRDVAPQHYDKIIVTQVVPSPAATDLETVHAYRAMHAKHFPEDEPNYVALEGFINARVLVEALRRVGPDLSRSKLVRALENMKDEEFGLGKKVGFAEYDHSGLAGIYYSRLGRDEAFEVFNP